MFQKAEPTKPRPNPPSGILPYPKQGEQWRHVKTGNVGTIFGLHMIWANYRDGDGIWLPGPCLCTAKSDIKASDQCVIFKGDDQVFVREIGNFLERFERVK